MQNEKKGFLAGKGFYIILLLCAAAIGVSSYVIFRGDDQEIPEVNAAVQESETQTLPAAANSNDKTTETTHSTESQKPTVPASSLVTPPTTEASTKPLWLQPVSGAVSRAFSGETLVYCATLGDWRTHNGVDLACPVGTEVKAIGDGVVTDVSDEGLTGMTVTVEHIGGYTAVYANLDANAMVKKGDALTAGDVLGKVGKTMASEAADQEHLHVEVLKSGRYIDPLMLFGE